MARPSQYDVIQVPKRAKILRSIKKLQKDLNAEHKLEKLGINGIPMYHAVVIAVEEALAKREEARSGKRPY